MSKSSPLHNSSAFKSTDSARECSHTSQPGSAINSARLIRRKNGFSMPRNKLQTSALALLAMLLLVYIGILSYNPLFNPFPLRLCVTLFYFLCFGLTIYNGYYVCAIDPIDSISTSVLTTGKSKYCYHCQTNVHVKSMHCRICMKCVEVFDHHCQWLNTCIGAKNYSYFIKTVIALAFFCITHVAVTLLIIVRYYTGDKEHIMPGNNDWIQIGIMVFFALPTSFSILSILQLLIFHYRVHYKQKLTTYAYIVNLNKTRHEIRLIQEEMEQDGKIMPWQTLLVNFFGSRCDPAAIEHRKRTVETKDRDDCIRRMQEVSKREKSKGEKKKKMLSSQLPQTFEYDDKSQGRKDFGERSQSFLENSEEISLSQQPHDIELNSRFHLKKTHASKRSLFPSDVFMEDFVGKKEMNGKRSESLHELEISALSTHKAINSFSERCLKESQRNSHIQTPKRMFFNSPKASEEELSLDSDT